MRPRGGCLGGHSLASYAALKDTAPHNAGSLVNDHDKLRYDPALAIALEKLDFINSQKTGLAGKSTINRLEYCPETIINSVIKSLP